LLREKKNRLPRRRLELKWLQELLRPNKKELRLRLRLFVSIERTESKRLELRNSREKNKNASLPKKDVSKPKLPNNRESSESLRRDVELSQLNAQKNCAKK
jgi:hypothetical protein